MASKIRVAYLIDTISCDTAGTEKQLLHTLERLNRQFFDPCLICLHGSEWLQANSLPCEVITLGYRGFLKLSFWEVLRELAALLDERRFNIVNTFFSDSIFVAYLGQFFSTSTPVLLSNRRDIGLGTEPWYHHIYSPLLPLANRRFHGIIVNSNSVKEYVIRREAVPEEKVKVIRNGVSIPTRLEPTPEFFKRRQTDIWICTVASLTKVKRLDLFLRALAETKNRVGDRFTIRGLILGDGPEKEHLFEIVNELGLRDVVDLPGAVSNVIPYLQRIDIGVSCSDREGLSNAILEYMSCSLPIVARNVGGNPELVDATNGFCVDPRDPDALTEALTKLAMDPHLRQIMGRRSLDKVKDSYSWKKTMTNLEGYYYDLNRKHSSSPTLVN